MNIHLKREAAHSAVKPLAGKVCVERDNSGIGLGIARAFGTSRLDGSAGIAWALPSEIEKIRQQISGEFGVEVCYSAADMTEARCDRRNDRRDRQRASPA